VDKILNGEDIVLAKSLLNDLVVGEGYALLVDFAVAALIDQLTNRLEVRLAALTSDRVSTFAVNEHIPICDVGLNKTEHLLSSPCHLDKHAVVDLEQTEELQNLAGFGCDFVDTACN
jgi:hypothetical protein